MTSSEQQNLKFYYEKQYLKLEFKQNKNQTNKQKCIS